MSQVKHQWLSWAEVSNAHLRLFSPNIPKTKLTHKIIKTISINGLKDVDYYHYVEFEDELPNDQFPTCKIAQGAAYSVFPNLHYPKWHLKAGSIVVMREKGLKKWLDDSLSTPFLGIETDRYFYLTTDDIDDMVLIKLRCSEISE